MRIPKLLTSNFTKFVLEDLYNQLEPRIKLDLSAASLTAMSLSDLLNYYNDEPNSKEEFITALLDTKLSYSTQYGSELAREAICKLYTSIEHSALSIQHILLSSGASEAIFLLMSTMLQAGDSIIVQQPIYQSLYQVAADRGVQVLDWNLEDHYSWDLNKLADLIKTNPQVKALVINNPNNPTGLGFKRAELKQIARLLDGRYLISDEVQLFISASHLPSVLEVYEHSIAISDLSKSFNMPGLRLGWIATNIQRSTDLLEQCSALQSYLSLRVNSLSELITTWVLGKHQEISSKNRSLIQSHIKHLYSLDAASLIFDLSSIPQECIEGLCIFPKLKPEHEGFDFQALLDQRGIFIAEGKNFGKRWSKHLRIGLRDQLISMNQQ